MIDGYDGIPVRAVAERLGMSREKVRLLVQRGFLVKIPITGKSGK